MYYVHISDRDNSTAAGEATRYREIKAIEFLRVSKKNNIQKTQKAKTMMQWKLKCHNFSQHK